MGGFLPVPGQTIYGSSKAAVKLFTEGLNSELTGTNVHVMGVSPGAIGTNIAANSALVSDPSKVQKGMKMSTPQFAAEEIVKGIEATKYRVLEEAMQN